MAKEIRSYQVVVPVEFKCLAARIRWVSGGARILKIRRARPLERPWFEQDALIEVLDPKEHAGKKVSISLGDLPVSILLQLGDEAESRGITFWPDPPSDTSAMLTSTMLAVDFGDASTIETVQSEIQFAVVIGSCHTAEQEPRVIDLEELEREFRDLKEKDVKSLAAFFRHYGSWSARYEPVRDGIEDASPEFEPDPPNQIARVIRLKQPSAIAVVVPEMIWRERRRLGAEIIQAEHDASAWFALNNLASRFETKSEFPHFVLTDHYCLNALRTKTTLAFLAGEKYEICARPGCDTPFIPRGKQLKYHRTECGKTVSRSKDRKKKQLAAKKLREKTVESAQ